MAPRNINNRYTVYINQKKKYDYVPGKKSNKARTRNGRPNRKLALSTDSGSSTLVLLTAATPATYTALPGIYPCSYLCGLQLSEKS